jgi:hypothetical protein
MAGNLLLKHQRNNSVYVNLRPSSKRKGSKTVKVIGFYFKRNITVKSMEWRPSTELTLT